MWEGLDRQWDVVIVGGGITGAAILGAAVQRGWSALLVEQRDFAWGASSRSSKLVHGGLRYLKEGKVGLTRASARERKLLLDEYPDLIKPLGFSLATYDGVHPGRWQYKLGLSVYDVLVGRWNHERHSPEQLRLIVPNLAPEGLNGGFRFQEAVTDDARLVIELIREAVAGGASAINYVRAEDLTRRSGRVTGLALRDTESDRVTSVNAGFVINATGAWADRLREQVGGSPRIRPLRGSHLVLPAWRLPLPQAVSRPHPWDGRPVFALPWEGATVVGTTDEDHEPSLDSEPRITPQETAYLMAFLDDLFPSLCISREDLVSTFAGVRPVIGTGEPDPSKEARDHVVWEENGLVTVTGGKLTTFRLIARDALAEIEKVAQGQSFETRKEGKRRRISKRRTSGRRAAKVGAVAGQVRHAELEPIEGTHRLWAELRRAAAEDGVVHLDDLLLRRVRIGLLLNDGGAAMLPRVKDICAEELGWDDDRWEMEEAGYLKTWHRSYSPPTLETLTSAAQ